MSNDNSTAVDDDIQIRGAGLSDLSAIQELYLHHAPNHPDPTERPGENTALLGWQMKRLRQALMAEQLYAALLAETADGTAVGYCSALIKENRTAFAVPVYAEIAELYVTDTVDDRNELVQRLLQSMSVVLRKRGIEKMMVIVGTDSDRTLLESMGYSTVAFYLYGPSEQQEEVAADD